MSDDLEMVLSSNNPFRDVGVPDPDAKLIKADLAAEILRILRERDLTGAAGAQLAGVQEADISRIRKADLSRFTIDRLIRILNALDDSLEVVLEIRPREASQPERTLRRRA